MRGDADAVAALLLDMELTTAERDSINAFWLLDLELPDHQEGCPTWREHRNVLLPHFIKRHPGRRPSRWWSYDAPRSLPGVRPGWDIDGKFTLPRQRLAGVGTAAWEVLAVDPEFHSGIPVEWVTQEEVEWCTAEGIDAV